MYGLRVSKPAAIIRRDFISMSAGALGVLLLDGCARKEPRVGNAITWDEFVTELVPRAESLLAKRITEEQYVAGLVEVLSRVGLKQVQHRDELPQSDLYELAMFELPEDRGFNWHDHRNYNGVIFVLEGAVRIQNAKVLDEHRSPPPGKKFRIRKTIDQVLTVGQFSTLTTSRDNLHEVRGAAGGCRLLDIFTWIGSNPRSVYLTVSSDPLDQSRKVFEASFVS